MMRITDGKGFQMTFANGWTVSVQFGYGNYGDNYNMPMFSVANGFDFDERNREAGKRGSSQAEIAAWDKDGTWLRFGDAKDEYRDTVKGYVDVNEVAYFIGKVSGFDANADVINQKGEL